MEEVPREGLGSWVPPERVIGESGETWEGRVDGTPWILLLNKLPVVHESFINSSVTYLLI